MRFAVLADTHVGFLPGDGSLERAIEEINGLDLDFVVFLGDLVDQTRGGGIIRLYERFAACAGRLRHPARYVLGNHDLDRSLPEPAAPFMAHTGTRSTYYGFSVGAHHLIVLDTNEGPGETAGRISQTQLDWFRSELARLERETPVIILTHHPPFPADRYRLDGFPDFFAAIAGYHGLEKPDCRVVAVLSGHRHYQETHVVDGIRFEVMGPLSFGLWDMTEVGYTLVDASDGGLRCTWRALWPSPPAPSDGKG